MRPRQGLQRSGFQPVCQFRDRGGRGAASRSRGRCVARAAAHPRSCPARLRPARDRHTGGSLQYDFPQPPEIWRRFQEEGCEFLASGRWRADGALAVELEVWTEPSDEPALLFGGRDWAHAAAEAPEAARDLLACLYEVARGGSALVIAFDAHSEEQLHAAVLLTAFARAALPPPLQSTCLAALPLGSPEQLLTVQGASVVAYPTRAGELGAAYNLVSGQGGVLFSVTDGQNGGAKPDAGCRAYAEAAVKLAEKGSLAVLRFARKAGRLGEAAIQAPDTLPLSEIARVAAGAESPILDAALRGWQASPDPDAFRAAAGRGGLGGCQPLRADGAGGRESPSSVRR